MQMKDEGITQTRENGIAILTLETGSFKHSLTYSLGWLLELLNDDPEVRAVIVTGIKNIFLSGGELREFRRLNTYDRTLQYLEIPGVFCNILYSFKKPIVAAINGYCLGGGLEFALACDFRVAVDDMIDTEGRSIPFIGFPETRIGLVPTLGGTQLLPKTVRAGLAKELLLSAEPISARRALEIGLVDMLAPRETLIEKAKVLVNSIAPAKCSPHFEHKKLLNRSLFANPL